MDAVSDPRVQEVWVQKAAQIGWTEIINNTLGFYIDQDPAPTLLIQPTLEMADEWSKDRLSPMVRDTPCLRAKVSDAKTRESSNTIRHKKYPGGQLAIAGANSPAGLASRPVRVLLCDEVDRYPASAGTEGDPISLGKKRTKTFWNRKMLAGSTPTIKGQSRIEKGFESSDQRYYYVPCPACDGFQRLVWSQVRWPEGRPLEAGYACVHCGVLILESQKYEMLRRGEWRASKPFSGIAGFHISEIYSPWSTWGEMASSFLEAKKLPETLQTWINTSLGETWEEKGDTVEAGGLLARREAYTHESLPPGVLLLTAGTDVQDDRLEVTIWGFGADEEMWRVEHIVLRGNPGGAQIWREHDDILRRRFRTDDGRVLVIEACAVDSGGHFTEQVYQYCAARKRYRVWAIKGVAGFGKLIWPKKASRGGTKRVDLWTIGVDTIKDLIYGRLKSVVEPGPGYLHFDAGTSEEWLTQLTSEIVVFRVVLGRRVRQYKPRKQGVRQEALDTTNYAYAAFIGRNGPKVVQARAAMQTSAQAPAPDETDAGAPPVDPPAVSSEQLQPRRERKPKRQRVPWLQRHKW